MFYVPLSIYCIGWYVPFLGRLKTSLFPESYINIMLCKEFGQEMFVVVNSINTAEYNFLELCRF
jgi:hypothetical protein